MGQAKENKYSEKADFKHNIARTSAKRLSSNNTSVMAIFYVFKLAYLLAFFFGESSNHPSFCYHAFSKIQCSSKNNVFFSLGCLIFHKAFLFAIITLR